MSDHRKPPKPAAWGNKADMCWVCGKAIDKGRFHKGCKDLWKFANNPSYAREVIFKRDQGRCSCGAVDAHWILDHIHPLRVAGNNLHLWGPSNVQTLCRKCEKGKTAGDAKRLAKEKRQREKFGDLRGRVNCFR